ncbi:alpha/beta fold hydrolase [Exiguobacterium flavidum]|uniref:alpha/beta fold hydrolase n=1 Tax=Exiguobacterium flavidum TaxID=2184695 RepID=UPI000DF868B7|nr:alpha/beta hydrolase [Exiguobacterium flavidum]
MRCIGEYEGTRFEYRDVGQGPVILLLHGTQSSCHEVYHVDALRQAGYRLLIPSRPGYGKTPLQNEDARTLANFYRRWLEELGIDDYAVYGISAGGPTAIALAADNHAVRALVLAAAVTGSVDVAFKRILIHPAFQAPSLLLQHAIWGLAKRANKKRPDASAVRLTGLTSLLGLSDIEPRLSDGDIELMKTTIGAMGPGRGLLFDLTQEVGETELRRIDCPVLIVHSKADKAVPYENALHAKRLIPQAQLLTSKSPGHLIWTGPSAKRDERTIERFLFLNHRQAESEQ